METSHSQKLWALTQQMAAITLLETFVVIAAIYTAISLDAGRMAPEQNIVFWLIAILVALAIGLNIWGIVTIVRYAIASKMSTEFAIGLVSLFVFMQWPIGTSANLAYMTFKSWKANERK